MYSFLPALALRFSLKKIATACFWFFTLGPDLLPEWSFPAFHFENTSSAGITPALPLAGPESSALPSAWFPRPARPCAVPLPRELRASLRAVASCVQRRHSSLRGRETC